VGVTRWLRRHADYLAFAAGVTSTATGGFLSPAPYLGFAVIGAGLVWAAYDLVDTDTDGGES
jgi:hypothetical protein